MTREAFLLWLTGLLTDRGVLVSRWAVGPDLSDLELTLPDGRRVRLRTLRTGPS